MNAPSRLDSTPRLEDFPYRLTDNVRFADLDPNQHVNNAVYATYFETGRVTLMKDRSYWQLPDGLTWIMVRLDIHFRAELRWPGTIEMGLGVSKFEDLRHFRSGGVFARPLRGVGAIGDGADRRGQAPARVVAGPGDAAPRLLIHNPAGGVRFGVPCPRLRGHAPRTEPTVGRMPTKTWARHPALV